MYLIKIMVFNLLINEGSDLKIWLGEDMSWLITFKR